LILGASDISLNTCGETWIAMAKVSRQQNQRSESTEKAIEQQTIDCSRLLGFDSFGARAEQDCEKKKSRLVERDADHVPNDGETECMRRHSQRALASSQHPQISEVEREEREMSSW
jgi:hypothetical protein